MSNDDFEDFLDDDEPRRRDDGPAKLRKAYDAQKEKLATLEKELVSLRTQARQGVISQVLTSKGLNPKVAKYVPADIEPTQDAIEKWLAEDGDVFAGQTVNSTEDDAPPAGMDQTDVAAAQQIGRITLGAGSFDAGTVDRAIDAINKAKTPEEIDAAMRQAMSGRL